METHLNFRLRASNLPFKLCSNESTQTRSQFADKLRGHGFELEDTDILCPAPVLASVLKDKQMRPFLVVHPGMYAMSEDEVKR